MNVHIDTTSASNAPARIEGEKRRQEANSAVATAPDTEAAPVALTGLDLAWAEFRSARDHWALTIERNGDLDEDRPAFEATEAACIALAKYQCQTDADVQRKIEILLKEPLVRETAQGGDDEDGDVFDAFLKSLQIRAKAGASEATVAALYRQYLDSREIPEDATAEVIRWHRRNWNASFNAASKLKPGCLETLVMLLVIRTEINLLPIDPELFDAIQSFADELASKYEANTPTIESLFEEWKALRSIADDPSASEEDQDKACDASSEVEKRILALPAVTAVDLAKKLTAYTVGGRYAVSEQLMGEIAALSGYDGEARS